MENSLKFKYELNVPHKTSSTLEVFSVDSAESFMPINYLAKLRRSGKEESLVIKFLFFKKAYKSENMSSPGSMYNSHRRGSK